MKKLRLLKGIKAAPVLATVLVLLAANSLVAGTTLDFWHSYVHGQTHEPHYSFHLSQYKRGFFWGSCGPSSKSLQWSFTFDLAGKGPDYQPKDISISDDNGKALHVLSGQINTTAKGTVAKINIQVESGGRTNQFIGNGDYRIQKLK